MSDHKPHVSHHRARLATMSCSAAILGACFCLQRLQDQCCHAAGLLMPHTDPWPCSSPGMAAQMRAAASAGHVCQVGDHGRWHGASPWLVKHCGIAARILARSCHDTDQQGLQLGAVTGCQRVVLLDSVCRVGLELNETAPQPRSPAEWVQQMQTASVTARRPAACITLQHGTGQWNANTHWCTQIGKRNGDV